MSQKDSKIDDPFGLSPVWDAAVEVYHEVARICKRHGLRYYMSDGNALGAMRHGGFIPWDDDFDLTMPRPDYDRFIQYAKTELPPNLKFVNWENTPEFKMYFGKVQETSEEKVRALESKVGYRLSNGIFIDIFPLDGYPKSRIMRKVLRAHGLLLNLMARYRFGRFASQVGFANKLAWLCGLAFAPLGLKYRTELDFRSAHERNLRKISFENAQFVGRCCTTNTVLCRKPMLKSAWGEARWVEFYKGEEFPLPFDTDEILHNEYGDWRTMPDEKDRHPTHEYETRSPWWLGPTSGSIGAEKL